MEINKMAKVNKIVLNEVKASIIDGKLIVETIDIETGEIKEVDVLEATEKILKESVEPILDITIKEFKPKKESTRKPIFKYKCGCGKEIKSNEEDLNISCKDCSRDFEVEEQ